MKYFTSNQIGRSFILRMERGDLLKEEIGKLCQDENIKNAVVSSGIATFDIVNIQMTNTRDYPIGYVIHNLCEPLELASLDGTIIDGEPHLHGVIGNGQQTWSGHLLEDCRILYLGEVIIQEFLNIDLIRKPDKDNVFLISKK